MTTADPTTRQRAVRSSVRSDGGALGILAAITYIPLFLTHHGRLNADTKLYLYLDPGGLLGSAPDLWNRRWSGGTVTHQNVGYLWPMGPYYWATDVLGIPDWVAQRFWLGTIMFAAAAGAYWCFRSLWSDRRAAVVGGIVYGLSPFVLGHITGQSALLLPFAALPWLVVAVRNALRADPWRWAAVFALVTTTAGALNGSSIVFVVAGAVLWVPYAVWWERSSTLRAGLTTIARLAGLTLAAQLWWLMAYRIGGAYGLPILQVTETVHQTSTTTSAVEVFRGLGYWFFYGGDNRGPWLEGFAPPFTQTLALLAVSFVAPLACLALGGWTRVRERGFFVALVVVGLLLSTIAFATSDRSVVGTAFESLSRRSDLVLSLRNTQRAAALLAFGLAGLGASGLAALRGRDLRLARTAAAVVAGAAILTFVAPWSTGLLPDRYQRPEAVPQAWIDTADYLDRVDGRALIVPGIDFGAYRWGHTLDPVLAGLTRTALIWREQLPTGGAPGADLVGALDQAIQGGWFDPRSLVPVARALGLTHIVVANDLEVERYEIVRPESVMAALLDPDAGVVLEREFGPGYVNRNPGVPIVDETALRTGAPRPLPEVAVFSVPGASADPVTVYAKGAETVVHGDGAGVLAAAASGLLDDGHLPLLSGADLRTWTAARRAARQPGARHIVTDTSRREVRRFFTLRENQGATESADGTPTSGLASDLRAEELTGADRASQSIAVLDGARSIDATGYGNLVGLLPEDRPANAFDGDARTAWRIDVPSFRSVRGDRPAELRIDLGRRVGADHVDVVQPADRPGTQPFAAFEVVLDGTRTFPATVDPAAATAPGGTRVALDGRPFSTLEVRIPDADVAGPIGIAEVRIPGVEVEEVIRLPRRVERLAADGTARRVAYALTRMRVDPASATRMDPELALRRAWRTAATETFTLSGTARVNGLAPDDLVDEVTGTSSSAARFSSTGRGRGDPASRASAAADGDLATAWRTPLDAAVGQRWTAELADPVSLTDLTLDVVADHEHSIPTRLAITVDGTRQELDVPAIQPAGDPGTTRRVVLTPAAPLVGRDVSIEVVAIAPGSAADVRGTPVTLPVALAEIGIPGAPAASATPTGGSACRADLLSIDGVAVPVAIGAPTGSDVRAPRPVTTCTGAPITLAAGRHVLRTTAGLSTGIDLDQLALASDAYTDAPTNDDGAPAPEVLRSDPHSAVVAGTGTPYWLRLNQSANRGWEAEARWRGGAADLGAAHPVDAFASGWSVDRGLDRRAAIRFSWAPQGGQTIAFLVSGLAVLACLALIALRPRRRDALDTAIPRIVVQPMRAPRLPLAAAIAVVAAGALFGGLAIGVALGGFAVAVALATRARWLAVAVRLTPIAALAAAAAFVVLKQLRNDYAHVLDWPTFFRPAHALAYVGLLAFALLVVADRADDVDPPDPAEPTGGP